MLKKILYSLAVFLLIFSATAAAQAPAYTFKAASGTYTPITGGTNVSYLYGAAANADDGYAAVTIPFNFIYNGVTYTTIRPCANGFASFGTALTGTTDTWTNDLANAFGAGRPILAPLWDDMDNTAGTTSYVTTGAAPDRVFTLQWANSKWNYNALGPVVSFQIKLYETTNVIEFIYNPESAAIAGGTDGASVGITSTATGSGSFISLSSLGANPSISYTTETSTILSKPASGQIYRFTPYCTAGATDLTREKIARVQYNTINNPSTSTAGYENFGAQMTQVEPSSNYTMTVTPNASAVATDQVIVYVDLNQNGSFADAGETLYTSPQGAGPYTFALPIPAGASIGITRMRIRLQDAVTGANSTPCGTSQYGQVEDYSLNIQNCSPATITTQPPNTTVCVGNATSIAMANIGTGITYQWQISTNGGGTWTNIAAGAPYSGVTTNTLSIASTTTAMNGYQYRVVLNGTCTPANTTTSVATLTVNSPTAITTQPVNTAACYNSNAVFVVAASGNNVTYQWQVSTDGGFVYSNISGATSAALTLANVKENLNGNRYRVVVNVASCGSVTSSPAVLTVNLLPTAFITAEPVNRLKPGVVISLTATASPSVSTNTFTWFKDGVAAGTGNKIDINYTGIGDYTVKVTDAKGCSATSEVFAVNDSASKKVFITPNPNNGKFAVLLHSARYNSLHRLVTIYDVRGSKMWTQDYTVSGPYQPMNVDITNLPKGFYYVEVSDFRGNRLGSGKVIVQ